MLLVAVADLLPVLMSANVDCFITIARAIITIALVVASTRTSFKNRVDPSGDCHACH